MCSLQGPRRATAPGVSAERTTTPRPDARRAGQTCHRKRHWQPPTPLPQCGAQQHRRDSDEQGPFGTMDYPAQQVPADKIRPQPVLPAWSLGPDQDIRPKGVIGRNQRSEYTQQDYDRSHDSPTGGKTVAPGEGSRPPEATLPGASSFLSLQNQPGLPIRCPHSQPFQQPARPSVVQQGRTPPTHNLNPDAELAGPSRIVFSGLTRRSSCP